MTELPTELRPPEGSVDRPRTPESERSSFLTRPGEFTTAMALSIVMLLVAATGMLGFRAGSQSEDADLPEGFVNVEQLYEAIVDDHVDEPTDDELLSGAIQGMLGTLEDPYAVYYDPDRYDRLNADLDGEFVGVGVTIEERTDGVYITGVIPGSPAEEAGVVAGERITSIDGTDTTTDEITSGTVIELIAGDEGVTRVIGLDSGEPGPRELSLTLRRIDLPQVAAETLDSGYGHLIVSSFSRNIAEQMTEELESFDEEGVPGIVLDLRGNPGGLLEEAIDVVSLFVEEGTVTSVESRFGTREHHARGNAVAPDVPLVVLVDQNSASASEIVAGALQDLGRAEIVGEATFGKGTVQTIQDLSLGAGVKFTTAEYFTPSGDSIEGVGVSPDVIAEGDAESVLASGEDVLADIVVDAQGSDEDS